MKKITVLTSVLALAACGGGSGGGGGTGGMGFGGDVVIPSVDVNETVRASNLKVTSSVDNGMKRNKVIENNYLAAGLDVPEMDTLHASGGAGTTPLQSRAATTRKSQRDFGWDFVDGMYSNMNYWLGKSNRKPKSDAEYEQFKHALIMAGYVRDEHNNNLFKDKTLAQIKDIIDEILSGGLIDDIRDRAESVYEELGTFKQFKIEESEMFFIPEDGGQNRIVFNVNKDDMIDGVKIKQHGEAGVEMNVDFERTDFDKNSYNSYFVTHSYILDNIDVVGEHDYDEGGGNHAIELEGTDILGLPDLKEKFKVEIEREYENGKFHGYHCYTQQEREEAIKILNERGNSVPTGQEIEQVAGDIAAKRMRDAALARVDAWQSESDVLQEDTHHKIDMDIKTYGAEVGLAYSDFGALRMVAKDWQPDAGQTEDEAELEGQETIIYGGYKDNKVEKVAKNTTFNGRANGIVRYEIEENNGDDIIASAAKDIYGDATLVVDVTQAGVTETLNASFKDTNWYDVEMVSNGDSHTISFTDNTKVDGISAIEANYQLLGQPDPETGVYVVDDFTSGDHFDPDGDTIVGHRQGGFEIQYYGNKSDNPTEAVGYVAYREGQPFNSGESQSSNPDRVKTVGVEFGFGVQKDFTK